MEDAATELITPPEYDWSAGYNEWNNYNNDKYKTCVPAAAAHLRISWTHNSNKPVKAASVQTVMDTLRLVAPSQDITKGCYMSDFMSHWRSKGMDGVKIARYIPIKKQHTDLLKQAVYWFGGCLIGLQLPQSAIGKTVWNYPSEEPEKDNIEWGGHTVCVLGYSGSGFTVISWGQRIVMSHEFYRQYNDESYVTLSRVDWTTEKDQSPTSEKQSYSQLNKLMNKIYTV
jgi:hypothetical protein